MAIIVETGAIVSNANSYVSVAEADIWHEDRNNTSWANADDVSKEAALIKSVEAIENKYRGLWVGVKTNNNDLVKPQPLAWPRKKEVDRDDPIEDFDGIEIGVNTIPQQVKHAQYEAALLELTERIIPSKIASDDRYVKRTKVDVIEQEFFETKPAIDAYPVLDRLLVGLATVGANTLEIAIGLTDEERNQDTPTLEKYITNKTYFN